MTEPLKVVFMGTSDFAVPALQALQSAGYVIPLIVTQPDRPAGRGLELKPSAVKKKALELGLPVYQPEKVKVSDAVETLRKTNPDVVVVAAYGQILPLSVLQTPKIACLNIHGSILPKYRGAAPIHYAVMNGETETGVTIIYMNEKMDEGDILLTKKTSIGPEETTGEVHDRLALLGAESVVEALRLLVAEKIPRLPQDHSKATYAPSIKRELCRLDWKSSATQVFNRVRGLSPWPGAETAWRAIELKVHKAFLDGRDGKPGEVLEVSKAGAVVGTGKGSIRLIEIQPPGKKKMNSYDFALGHPDFKPGAVLL